MKVYSKTIEGLEYKIFVGPNNNVLIPVTQGAKVLKELNLDRIYYPNMSTVYGSVYQNGEVMKSGIIVEDESVDGQKLNANEIYNLKPGDKLKFSLSLSNKYAQQNEHKLIREGEELEKQGRKEEAKALYKKAKDNMVIYIRTANGELIQYLKAGEESSESSNFNKVREQAFKTLKERLNDPFAALVDDSIIDIGLETTVKKFFIGSPNFVVENGKLKNFPVTKEQQSQITDISFGNRASAEKEGIRVAFLPKETKTAYVVIEQFGTKIAYPVTLTADKNTIENSIYEIFNDPKLKTDNQKENALIKLLKLNGLNPLEFNLEGLEENTQEISNIVDKITEENKFFTEKIVKEAQGNKEKRDLLLVNASLTVDLNNPVAVSPKVVMNLNEDNGLLNVETGEKSSSKTKTPLERKAMIEPHVTLLGQINSELSAAEFLKAVNNLAYRIGGEFHALYSTNTTFRNEVQKVAKKVTSVPSISTEQMVEEDIKDTVDTEEVGIPADINDEFAEDVEDIKQEPTESKIKTLAKKLIKVLQNKYALVTKSKIADTNNLYHIATSQTKEEMFELGFVRVAGDFYRKIDNKYTVEKLVDGLYEQYKKGTLPEHVLEFVKLKYEQAQEGNVNEDLLIGKKDFTNLMPKTLVDLYEAYYNTQPKNIMTKESAEVENSNYLKEEFKGDFKNFIKKQPKNSDLYINVLSHFNLEGTNILKNDLLSREKIDQYQEELGDFYNPLLQYSIINKHIDLQESPQEIIFAEDFDDLQRINAVNDPNLPKPKTEITPLTDEIISIKKSNEPFVQYEGDVYEKIQSDKQGNSVYKFIAKMDPNFIITKVAAPIPKNYTTTKIEIDTTSTEINTTEGSELGC